MFGRSIVFAAAVALAGAAAAQTPAANNAGTRPAAVRATPVPDCVGDARTADCAPPSVAVDKSAQPYRAAGTRPAAVRPTSVPDCVGDARTTDCAPSSVAADKGAPLYRVSPATARFAEPEPSVFRFGGPEPMVKFKDSGDGTGWNDGATPRDLCANSMRQMHQAPPSERGLKESQARRDCRGVSISD